MSEKKRVLALTAHDDDVSIHAGGVLGELVDRGWDAKVCIMTLGMRGKRLPAFGDRFAWDVRTNESRAAYAYFGIEPDFSLTRFEEDYDVNSLDREVARLVADYQPDLYLAHWGIDVHPDHRIVSAVTQRPAYQKGVNTPILFFQPHSAGRAGPSKTRPQGWCFVPTHYFPMTERHIERKRRATFCHESQDPENMWGGQTNVEKEHVAAVREHFPIFMNGFDRCEAYISGQRAGDLPDELLEFLRPTPFTLPRAVPSFDPKNIGVTLPVLEAAE